MAAELPEFVALSSPDGNFRESTSNPLLELITEQAKSFKSERHDDKLVKGTANRITSLQVYRSLGVPSTASSDEVRRVFFDKALRYHPDLHPPGDQQAATEFRRLAEAYHVLCDNARRQRYDESGQADLQSFSMEEVLRQCAKEVFFGAGDLDDLIADTLQLRPDSINQTFADSLMSGSAQRGSSPIRRLRCDICGFEARGRGHMQDHIVKTHASGDEAWRPLAWGDDITRRTSEAFDTFLQQALAPDAAMRHGFADAPDVCWSGEEELNSALLSSDPCSYEAVARALQRAPPESLEAAGRLRDFVGDGVYGYLAPLEGQDPDPAAPGQLLRATADAERKRRSGAGHRRHLRESGSNAQNDIAQLEAVGSVQIGCSCGFTCGTREALERHVARSSQDGSEHKGYVEP